ncbi:MAG: phosphotriesterase [Eubacteriales bacterium]|nr:phosphotriesterase [Eubacteriales bacterium]
MGTVQTLLGELSTKQLGHAQLHEHLFVEMTPAALVNPALRIDDRQKSLHELLFYREAGGCTVLDAQPLCAGRNAGVLRELSEKSGVNIIGVTGYHLEQFYEKNAACLAGDVEAVTERYLFDLECGMDGTDCLAGAVKAAIPREGAVGRYQVLLCAAAKAAAKADVPILLHTEAGENALLAIDLITACGVPPQKILVCHADRQAADYSVHEAIAKTGVWLEYDTIGRLKYHSDEAEKNLLLHMLSRGCQGRILLALDTTAKRLKTYGGEVGLVYLIETFLPYLSKNGVDGKTIQQLTVENPAKVFA